MIKYKLTDIPRGDYIYPRTLSKAFGGTPTGLTLEHEPMKAAEKLFCWAVGAIGVALMVLIWVGEL
jgi:hypothetical protein